MERPPDPVAHALDTIQQHREALEQLARALPPGSAGAALAARVCAGLAVVEDDVLGLAGLVAGLSSLHASSDRRGVFLALQAIVMDVLGSDELVIYERSGSDLVPAHSHGVTAAALDSVVFGDAGARALRTTAWVREPAATASDPELTLSACVPLVATGGVVGAVAIFRLSSRKARLEARDHAVLALLGLHGGAALQRAALEACAPEQR